LPYNAALAQHIKATARYRTWMHPRRTAAAEFPSNCRGVI